MQKHYVVHPLKLAVSLTTSFVSLAVGGCLIYLRNWFPAVVFIVIGMLFLMVASVFGAVITISERGVSRSLLVLFNKDLLWSQIEEIGVAGTKIFKSSDSKKTGTLYIYFSPKSMTEQERFDMMLNWPPKDKLFLLHSRERMDAIQLFWSNKIQTYNAGDIRFS